MRWVDGSLASAERRMREEQAMKCVGHASCLRAQRVPETKCQNPYLRRKT